VNQGTNKIWIHGTGEEIDLETCPLETPITISYGGLITILRHIYDLQVRLDEIDTKAHQKE